MSINVVDKYGIDMSGNADNTAKLAQIAADLKTIVNSNRPLPRIVFPDGICAFDRFPNLAFYGAQIVAEGQCILKHTGVGDAVALDAAALYPNNDGAYHILFDGFTIVPNGKSANGLVIAGCHWSKVRVNVHGAGAPVNGAKHTAIAMNFCVLTHLEAPSVCANDASREPWGNKGPWDCIGITLDKDSKGQETTCARITIPNIQGVDTALYLKQSGIARVYDGSLEYCNVAVNIENGGNNIMLAVEMEGNKTYDIVTSDHAHDNTFWECGQGKPFAQKNNIRGWNNRVIHGAVEGLFGL